MEKLHGGNFPADERPGINPEGAEDLRGLVSAEDGVFVLREGDEGVGHGDSFGGLFVASQASRRIWSALGNSAD